MVKNRFQRTKKGPLLGAYWAVPAVGRHGLGIAGSLLLFWFIGHFQD